MSQTEKCQTNKNLRVNYATRVVEKGVKMLILYYDPKKNIENSLTSLYNTDFVSVSVSLFRLTHIIVSLLCWSRFGNRSVVRHAVYIVQGKQCLVKFWY